VNKVRLGPKAALAAQAIRAGDGTAYVAGGMESMSNAPYLLRRARQGVRLGHDELTDVMVADGLWDVYENFHMGNTAELVAREFGVTRRMQDEFATMSHRKAAAAAAAGKFDKEIVASTSPKKGRRSSSRGRGRPDGHPARPSWTRPPATPPRSRTAGPRSS
jgi:acetyl-CoA C-acetyltransferase